MKISKRGFTLIELLIVIAIIAVLAVAVLAALNPLEQIAKGRDSGREQSIGTLANAILAYQTSQLLADLSTLNVSGWQTVLVSSGEIKNVITVSEPSTTCVAGTGPPVIHKEGGVCLAYYDPNVIIWTVLGSKSEWKRAGCTGTQVAISAWSSSQGKAGIGCIATATTAPALTISLK